MTSGRSISAAAPKEMATSAARRRLLLIGPVMPPKGGVSVHIARLQSLLSDDFEVLLLDESRQVKHGVPNIRALTPLRYLALMHQAQVVHIHSYSGVLKVVHALVARMLHRRVVLTVHSALNQHLPARMLLNLAAALAHKVITVNESIAQQIRKASMVVPAFLPPAQDELRVSESLRAWIESMKAQGRFVLASNAYRLEQHKSQDLYGLDVMIEAFRDPALSSCCACVFLVGSPEFDPDRLARYRAVLDEAGMSAYFRIHTEPESFSGVIQLCDATVRATNYDGDALSVRESIYLGKPAVASDAAVRPAEALLFRSRDPASLVAAVRRAMRLDQPIAPSQAGIAEHRATYRSILS